MSCIEPNQQKTNAVLDQTQAGAANGPEGYGLSTADVAVSDMEYSYSDDDEIQITSITKKTTSSQNVETITIDADVSSQTTPKKAEPIAESTPKKAVSHVGGKNTVEISDNENNHEADVSETNEDEF